MLLSSDFSACCFMWFSDICILSSNLERNWKSDLKNCLFSLKQHRTHTNLCNRGCVILLWGHTSVELSFDFSPRTWAHVPVVNDKLVLFIRIICWNYYVPSTAEHIHEPLNSLSNLVRNNKSVKVLNRNKHYIRKICILNQYVVNKSANQS